MKALLVIDIDHGDGWGFYSENKERKQVASAIKEILAAERANNGLIIFIVLMCSGASGQEAQYSLENIQGTKQSSLEIKTGDCLVCDTVVCGQRLAEFLEHRHDSEPGFIKRRGNAFENKNLEKYLREKAVTEVELVGCNTDQCVKDTAAGALKAGFKVALLARASFPLLIKNVADKSWWIAAVKQNAGMNPDLEAAISVVI